MAEARYWPAMIAKEQYNEWRHHPCTKVYRQFLKDRRQALIALSNETWLNDPSAFEVDKQEARGRILELFDCEDVPFERIEQFYKERDNEGEITVDQESGIHSGAVVRKK